MKQALLVIPSEDMLIQLEELLQNNYQTVSCRDSFTALDILENSKPDILVLDLELPGLDGLSLLEQAGNNVPESVIALSTSPSSFIFQLAHDLGVSHVLLKPCSIRGILTSFNHLVEEKSSKKRNKTDPQSTASRYLIELNIPPNLDGFKQLKAGIPLYAQDSTQRITKELYPKIAALFGCSNPDQVERSIRSAIHYGWSRRDPKKWAKYFPPDADGNMKCPTTKEFIACLAEKLLENWH